MGDVTDSNQSHSQQWTWERIQKSMHDYLNERQKELEQTSRDLIGNKSKMFMQDIGIAFKHLLEPEPATQTEYFRLKKEARIKQQTIQDVLVRGLRRMADRLDNENNYWHYGFATDSLTKPRNVLYPDSGWRPSVWNKIRDEEIVLSSNYNESAGNVLVFGTKHEVFYINMPKNVREVDLVLREVLQEFELMVWVEENIRDRKIYLNEGVSAGMMCEAIMQGVKEFNKEQLQPNKKENSESEEDHLLAALERICLGVGIEYGSWKDWGADRFKVKSMAKSLLGVYALDSDALRKKLDSIVASRGISKGWTTREKIESILHPKLRMGKVVFIAATELAVSNTVIKWMMPLKLPFDVSFLSEDEVSFDCPLWALLIAGSGLTAYQALKWYEVWQNRIYHKGVVSIGDTEDDDKLQISRESKLICAQTLLIGLFYPFIMNVEETALCPKLNDFESDLNNFDPLTMAAAGMALAVMLMGLTFVGKKYYTKTAFTTREFGGTLMLGFLAGMSMYLAPLLLEECGGHLLLQNATLGAFNMSRAVTVLCTAFLYHGVSSPSGRATQAAEEAKMARCSSS